MIEIDKVYNCDCLDLMRKMIGGGVQVDCVITDPPYGIKLETHKRKDKFDAIIGDDFTDNEQLGVIYEYFELCYQLLKKDAFLISFMSWKTIPQFNDAITKAGFTIKSMPIWVKDNFGIGYYTRPQYEPMYLCLKGNPPPPETAPSDVMHCSKVYGLMHSCQKPEDLIARLLNIYTKPEDLIFDGFMGSFTTAVACHKTKRHYIGAEIDKGYYELGVKRLNEETNQISLFD